MQRARVRHAPEYLFSYKYLFLPFRYTVRNSGIVQTRTFLGWDQSIYDLVFGCRPGYIFKVLNRFSADIKYTQGIVKGGQADPVKHIFYSPETFPSRIAETIGVYTGAV